MKYTHLLVALFIGVLLLASYSARASDGAYITLGHTVFNSSVTNAELSYRHSDWEFGVGQFGAENSTRNGPQDVHGYASISRLVYPGWRVAGGENYYRLGAAYVDDSPLVGNTNYRLGIGIDWGVFQVEFAHFSSAGMHPVNSGIDSVQARFHAGW